MGHCNICGTEQKYPFECASCGGTFCAKHKIPENHECPQNKAPPKTQSKTSITKQQTQKPTVNYSAPEAEPKKPKFSLGRYDIYEELGQGGFGKVYLAYSNEIKAFFALKTLRDEHLNNSDYRNLFKREANVWVDLEFHPHIVRAYIVEEIEKRLYVAMEYIPKNSQGLNTLSDYLERQPPDLPQILQWAIQFCYGMEYAYTKGLRCHRDIKPSNIMITQEKMLKVSDFGLAATLSAAEINGQSDKEGRKRRAESPQSLLRGRIAGTPLYMSPEQYIDAGICDQRSDLYSFGVVLAEMTTGGKSISLPQLFALLDRGMSVGVDPVLFSMISRCLKKDPNSRYQTFKELRLELETLLWQKTGETIKPPTLPDPTPLDLYYKGMNLSNLGRYEEALKCHNKVLESYPQLAYSWYYKGTNLFYLGRFEEARECYDRAVTIRPQIENELHPDNKTISPAQILWCLGSDLHKIRIVKSTET
jgi:eukaryotic-like serine/threonine-protein kinase